MCTANTVPYNEWLNLFTDDIESTWYSSFHPKLRNSVMLLKALDNEFKRIYNTAEENIKFLENKCNSEDKSLHRKDSIQEKENMSCNKSKDESPDVFLCTPSPTELNLSNRSYEVITSQESSSSHNAISPKINRFRKLPKFKKMKKKNDFNYSSLVENHTPKVPNRLHILRDVVDSTVTETTPEISVALKNSKSNRNHAKIAKKNKPLKQLNSATLTQILPNFSNRAVNENSDSDFTYCPNADEMTVSVNINSKANTEKEKPRRELIFKESVVRGKARLQLEGWDCVECKAFYDKLDLNTQETKEMLNKCSRHRSKFKPKDFTPKEFWNLDFPPTQ